MHIIYITRTYYGSIFKKVNFMDFREKLSKTCCILLNNISCPLTRCTNETKCLTLHGRCRLQLPKNL